MTENFTTWFRENWLDSKQLLDFVSQDFWMAAQNPFKGNSGRWRTSSDSLSRWSDTWQDIFNVLDQGFYDEWYSVS